MNQLAGEARLTVVRSGLGRRSMLMMGAMMSGGDERKRRCRLCKVGGMGGPTSVE